MDDPSYKTHIVASYGLCYLASLTGYQKVQQGMLLPLTLAYFYVGHVVQSQVSGSKAASRDSAESSTGTLKFCLEPSRSDGSNPYGDFP